MAAEKMIPLTKLPPAPQQKVDPPAVFSDKAEVYVAAQVKLVDELNNGVIPAHNSLVEPMNAVVGNMSNINTVSGMSAVVTSVAGIKANIVAVDGVKTQVSRVAQSADAVDRINTSITAVDTVNSHILNVDSVATNMPNVDIVAGISPAVSMVASDHDMLTRIDVQTPMLTRVDGIRADVSTVSGIALAVSTVAADHDKLLTVHEALPIIGRVEADLTHVVAVDSMSEAVKQTALHRNSIAAVGAGMDAVSAVADAMSSVEAVKDDLPHVRTVSGHMANVDAVGRNIASVREVDHRMQLIIDAPGNAATASAAAIEAARQAELARQHAASASAVSGLPAATEQNDQQPVIWDKDLDKFTFGAPGGANLIPAPAITMPAQLPVGFPTVYTLTGLPGLVGTEIVSFQFQVNEGEIVDLTATDNTYTGSLTAQGIGGAIWVIKARAIDSKGNVSLWNQITATLVEPYVAAPGVVSPLDGAIVNNQTIMLKSSAFLAIHLVDTHEASRWVLSTDEAGNNALHDSGWVTDALTQYTATLDPVYATDTDLYAHVTYRGVKLGESKRSTAVRLRTSYIMRPGIASPLVSSMVNTDVIDLTSSDFMTYAGDFDTHTASRWRVTSDAAGNNALADSGWTSEHLTAYTATLSPFAPPKTDLYLWVEHRGVLLGNSQRSTGVRVVTGYIQTPSIAMPVASSFILPTGFEVVGSAFAPVQGAQDTMVAMYIEVATDDLFTSKVYESGRIETESTTHAVVIPEQPQGTTLHVRLRYEGETLSLSAWSSATKITVTTAQTPSVTSPTDGLRGVSIKPVIAMSAYTDTGRLDTAVNSQVQIATSADFTGVLYESGELAYTLAHTVVTALVSGTPYHVRARHKGAALGWTAWTQATAFTTGQVQTSAVTSPADGGYVLPNTLTVSGSGFAVDAGTDTLKAVTVQVAKDVAFTNMVHNQRIVTGSPAATVTFSAQPQGSTLYTRLKYEGNAFGESDFSPYRRVVITTMQTPTITSPKNGAINVSLRPTVYLSAYNDTGKLDSGSKTRVQLSKYSNFSSIAWDSGDLSYRTGVAVNTDLDGGVPYYIRARHTGTKLGVSPWSSTTNITTDVIHLMGLGNVQPGAGQRITLLFNLPDGRFLLASSGHNVYTAIHVSLISMSGNNITVHATKVLTSLQYLYDGCVMQNGNVVLCGYGSGASFVVISVSGDTITCGRRTSFGVDFVAYGVRALSSNQIVFCGNIPTNKGMMGIATVSGTDITVQRILQVVTSSMERIASVCALSSGSVVFGGRTQTTAYDGATFYLVSISGTTMTVQDVKRVNVALNPYDRFLMSDVSGIVKLGQNRFAFGGSVTYLYTTNASRYQPLIGCGSTYGGSLSIDDMKVVQTNGSFSNIPRICISPGGKISMGGMQEVVGTRVYHGCIISGDVVNSAVSLTDLQLIGGSSQDAIRDIIAIDDSKLAFAGTGNGANMVGITTPTMYNATFPAPAGWTSRDWSQLNPRIQTWSPPIFAPTPAVTVISQTIRNDTVTLQNANLTQFSTYPF